MEKNRVDLDPTVTDRLGLPAPRLTHGQHPNDLAMHRWYQGKLLEIAEAAGATQKWISKVPGFTLLDERTPMNGGHVGHYMGTCRMGADPKTSVLDKWCRTHDVENLWVVDGSCFPTGHGPVASVPSRSPADLRRLADRYGQPLPAERLGHIVDGREVLPAHGSREMPVWGERFRNPEHGIDSRITKIVAYLDSIQAAAER